MAIPLKDWAAPPFEATDDKKLAWVKQCIEDGTRWVEDQCAAEDINKGIDMLSGEPGNDLSAGWSKLRTGDLQRAIREIVETLANIRPFWGYQTDNKAFLDQADMMNKVTKSLYLECFVDRSLRDALQFGALTGGGFISPFYARTMAGRGAGEFQFEALGQPDVLPVQLPRNRNYQEAYVVTLRRITGVHKAHSLFPAYQSKLKPFARDGYKRVKGGNQGVSNLSQQNRWRMHSISTMVEQYCDIFYTYVLDLRINDCVRDGEGKMILGEDGQPLGKELEMGQPNTSWFYKVPFVGQQITRWEDGRSVTRTATEDDCRVYPQRRLMISCDAALMYDGPAFEWHGMVPIVPFYLNDWAWEGTGYSLFRGTAALQEAIDALERSVYRIAMARANPGKAYNVDIMSKDAKLSSRTAEAMDPFDPNATFAVDGDIKDAVMRPPMPEWCYNVPEWVTGEADRLREAINRTLGLDQIQALQKLKANIQDPEKLLEAEGPVVIGTSRSMERGLRDLGEMTKYNVLQYMNTARTMQYVGSDGIAPEVFDYSPEALFPSHMPGEQTFDADGNLQLSMVDLNTRAKTFADNLRFFITPHSLHYIAQKEQQLNYLALIGKQVPIDPETLANVFSIPNWGSLDGSTVKEKVIAWAKDQLIAKADLAKLELAIMPHPPEGAEPPGKPKGGRPEGRPPTNAKNPKLRQKGTASGGRVTVSTSG